ncbi:MAG: arylsulfatase [Bryobacteraceae bacterium]
MVPSGTTRRQFVLGSAGGIAGAGLNARTQARPNVILILTDDQGYGDLSCHGNPAVKTPNIDRLYGQSVRLTDFHVAPMCTPTRSQLMTGRDCLANGAHRVCSGQSFIRPGIPTMAEIFSAAGYRTGLFGKWHLGDNYPHRPHDRGFQESVHHKGWGVGCVPDPWNNDYFNDLYCHNGKLQRYAGYCTDVWFSEACRFIEECGRRREPFFAYIATNAPHGPLFTPDKCREPYKARGMALASFFGMIANIDENTGKLEDLLARTGLRDNTILIFMTDNGATAGFNFYNAGMRGKKTDLYEGGHRVPFFLRWPAGRLRAPGDVGALAECQDVLPTLMDLCGIKAGARFDGVSLAPSLRGAAQPALGERVLVVQYGRQPQPEFIPVAKWDSAVMWNRWRLVAGKELFNLESDPGQKNDVAAANPKIVAKLRDRYERWWAEIEPSLAEPVPIVIGSGREPVTCLTSHDWVDANTANASAIRAGARRNGPWHVRVERAGRYEISLRRWPEEAGAAIVAGLPAHRPEDGNFPVVYPEGKALPVARARLKAGASDETKAVRAEDRAATFQINLAAGGTQIQTWFLSAQGEELCGAYYTYVRRLS